MFADEKAVWAFLRPRILGPGWHWERVEVKQPTGMPDVHGMRGPRAVWIELKEGPVSIRALRRDQREWIANAVRVGAEVYVLFGTSTGLKWFADQTLACEVCAPDFYRER